MKKLLLLAVLAACMVGAAAQAPLKGYIIGIENGQVYLDYNSLDVKIGDRISIVGEASVFTHPVTKEKITKSGETIATVEITETAKDYSVAGRIFPANALAKLIVGQRAVIAAGAESFGKRYRTDSGLADGRNPLYEYPLGTFAGRQPTFVGAGQNTMMHLQIAKGDSQLSLEQGALDGLQIRGGVDGFKQTVTGKALAMAFSLVGGDLKDYFDGNTTQRVKKQGFLDSELDFRKGSVYMGVNKLSSSDMKDVFSQTPQRYFDYKKGKRLKGWSYVPMAVGGGFSIVTIVFCLREEEFYIIPLSAGLAVTAGGVYMHIYGNKLIKRTVSDYNQSLQNKRQGYVSPEVTFGVSQNGLAFTLHF